MRGKKFEDRVVDFGYLVWIDLFFFNNQRKDGMLWLSLARLISFHFSTLFFSSFTPTHLTLVSSSQGPCRAWLLIGCTRGTSIAPAAPLWLISVALHVCSREELRSGPPSLREGLKF